MRHDTSNIQDQYRILSIHSMRFKMIAVIILMLLLLLAAVEITILRTIKNTVLEAMISRMESDINYIEDLIGDNEWQIKDDALYCGDILIGDGSFDNAYTEPFVKMEQKTGSFSSVFVICEDVQPERTENSKDGYQQGHYLRVSGSSHFDTGTAIIGTHMNKKVADILDKEGSYTGFTDVSIGLVFCDYHTLKDSNDNIVGAIVVGRSVQEIENLTRKAAHALLIMMILFMFLAATFLNIYVFRWFGKLNKANQYLLEISKGTFPDYALDLNTKDELKTTATCINQMTVSLKEKEHLNSEIVAAADIQAHMLPRVFPPFPERDEFDVFAVMSPAREIGGDFYDFFMTDSHHIAVIIADVSGNGIPASLLMSTARTLIKNNARTGMQPCDVFTTVNRYLCEGNESNTFVTAFMAVLDLQTGKLTYVNAGHNPPCLIHNNRDFGYLDIEPGVVLGIFDTVVYEQNELQIQPGGRLFLYTDGVTEATNKDNEQYGSDRLLAYLNRHKDSAITDTLSGLKTDISIFSGNDEQYDDITMLMLNYIRKEPM